MRVVERVWRANVGVRHCTAFVMATAWPSTGQVSTLGSVAVPQKYYDKSCNGARLSWFHTGMWNAGAPPDRYEFDVIPPGNEAFILLITK